MAMVKAGTAAAPDDILRVARAFDSAPPAALIVWLATLRTRSGFAARLQNLAVPQAILPDVADHALGDWFLLGDPRKNDTPAPLAALLDAFW